MSDHFAAHALLSPSGAHRWMRCPASLLKEALVPDQSSAYAEEGTRAHTAASLVLEGDLEAVVYDDDDMAEHVASYVRLVRQYAEGGVLLVEQRVQFTKFIQDDPDTPLLVDIINEKTGEVLEAHATAFGTSDAVILKTTERQLILIDLKYGMGVKVDAEENEQLMLYALGCLHEYDWAGPFDEIVMVIHQPRLNHVSEYVISVDHLLEFAEVAKAAVKAALTYGAPHQPGEKQCRFCKVKAICPALADDVMETVGDLSSFSDLTLSDGEELGGYMAKVGMVEDWCKAIRAEAERRLLAGQPVPGFKLVTGRQGPRKWTDEDAVEKQLRAWKYKADAIVTKSLLSPTQLEKFLKASPDRWEQLQDFISRSDGKPSVAPVSDKREEVKGSAGDLDSLEVIEPSFV